MSDMLFADEEALPQLWPYLDLEELSSSIVPADDKIKAIADLAADQVRLESDVREASARLKSLEAQLAVIQKKELPLAMAAAGMKSFELADGTEIKIKPEVYASITEQNAAEAFEWLEANGHGGIIKQEVKVPFGKGQNEQALELLAELRLKFAGAESKRTVHSSTLKAFAKEQLAKPETSSLLPRALFGVFEETISKVDIKKVKK